MSHRPPRFADRFLLRFHMIMILGGMLGVSALCNWFLLDYGVQSMFLRYPMTVIVGYGVFFLLIRLWLSYVHGLCGMHRHELDFSLPDKQTDNASGDSSWARYLDIGNAGCVDGEGCFVGLLLIGVIVIICGVAYYLNEAPAFLSDVAASFFLVGTLFKPANKIDRPSWTGSVLRWTAMPFVLALALAIGLAACSYCICPEAHTLGEVFRKWHSYH